MPTDLTPLAYFIPIISFLLVFVIIYALLAKTKILGENQFIQLLVSFLVAVIFVTAINVRQYIETITPWFAVLVIALFFILVLIGFSGKVPEGFQKGIGVIFIILLIVIFIVAGIKVFYYYLSPFLPLNSSVIGTALLIIIAVLVSWVLVKAKTK